MLIIKKMRVEFLSFLRDEIKFSNLEELKVQIKSDVENAKNFFRKTSPFKLALIGKNISHSRSQEMYEKILNKAVSYDLLDYENESEIPRLIDLRNKYHGVSVTAPYKKSFKQEGIIQNKKLDAINCIAFENDIKLYNTDYLASTEILDKLLSEDDYHVTLLGDGAMGKMVAIILDELELSYRIFSRKLGNLDSVNTELKKINQSHLIINCLSRSVIFEPHSNLKGCFWDLNYAHEEQLEVFREGNMNYIDGLELLFLQAKYAVNIWNLSTK